MILVKTLDEEEYEWKIPEKIAKGNKRNTSKGHFQTRQILKEIYPTHRIYEEVPFVVEGRKTLYFDFYIPSLKLAVEVHGRQHYEFVGFYHKSKLDFLLKQGNDRKKQEWCDLNNIQLIILPYNEKGKEWTLRIKQSTVS